MDLMDYRRKIIANSPHLASASGAVATFSDGADLPLKSLNVDIEPVQSGSGDPSPSNVRPITGWNGVKVTRCGKNLWNPVSSYPVTHNGVTYSRNADGSIHVQGTASGQSNNFPIASNGMSVYAGTYTMSVKTTDPNIHFIFGGGNGTSGVAYTDTFYDGSVKTFTTAGGTTGYNIIRINSGATVNGDIYIQLEEGSTATPYEPYNGVDVSVDLGQTVYGGTLNPLTGVLTVDKGCDTFDGSSDETWNILSSDNQRISFRGWLSNAKKETATSITDMMTNSIPLSTTSENAFNDGKITCRGTAYQSVYVYIFVPPSEFNTIGQLRAYLADQPWQVVYPLATPFEIQLTPHQIRSLYGNNTIFADTGNVALEYWAHP